MKRRRTPFIIFLIVLALGLMYLTRVINSSAATEFENSVPVQFALQKAKSNPVVTTLIGSEITLKSHSEQNKKKTRISLSFDGDKIDVEQQNINSELLLVGEKGEVILKIVGYKQNDIWIYQELSITVPNSEEKIYLLPSKSTKTNSSIWLCP